MTVLLLVVWLGLYIMFWVDRADCKQTVAACLGNAFGNWAGDVVMLGWVDQTLGAGLLAFGAGAFVYLTAYYQRRQAVIDAARQVRVDTLSSLAQLSLKVDRALMQIMQEQPEQLNVTIGSLDVVLGQMSRYSPGLVHWLQVIMHEIESDYVRPFKGGRPNHTRALAYITVAEQFFRGFERLVEVDGRYVHKPASSVALRERLESVGLGQVSLDSLPLAHGMFD